MILFQFHPWRLDIHSHTTPYKSISNTIFRTRNLDPDRRLVAKPPALPPTPHKPKRRKKKEKGM